MRTAITIFNFHCPECGQDWQAALPEACHGPVVRWATSGHQEAGICAKCLRRRWIETQRKAALLGLVEDELEVA
jgi:hypothetical protein